MTRTVQSPGPEQCRRHDQNSAIAMTRTVHVPESRCPQSSRHADQCRELKLMTPTSPTQLHPQCHPSAKHTSVRVTLDCANLALPAHGRDSEIRLMTPASCTVVYAPSCTHAHSSIKLVSGWFMTGRHGAGMVIYRFFHPGTAGKSPLVGSGKYMIM